MCGPPIRPARASMAEQRSEGELGPLLVGDNRQQEISAGFQYTRGFGERLIAPLAIEVIDRVGADDGIEGGRLERKFAHVGRHDGGALLYVGGFQVREQSLLR